MVSISYGRGVLKGSWGVLELVDLLGSWLVSVMASMRLYLGWLKESLDPGRLCGPMKVPREPIVGEEKNRTEQSRTCRFWVGMCNLHPI